MLALAPGAAPAASLEEVIARIKPSIVGVGSFERLRNPQFTFRGTGFAVGDGSLVATNAHVLADPIDPAKREAIAVAVPGIEGGEPQHREAQVVALDREHDLALLRLSGAPLPAMALSSAPMAREGQSAAFTGFPIGAVMGLVPVTHRALVAAVTPIALPGATAGQLNERLVRRLQSGAFRVLQLDATAYPGNSGSPLYDAQTGEVLGIVNLVFVKTTKESVLSQPSGISFAIPAQYLRELLSTIK